MSNLSDYLENKLVDHLFRSISFAAPSTLYLALFTANPTDSTAGTECAGTGYARIAVAPGTTNWANTQASGTSASSGTTGTTSNLLTITFSASAGAGWGTITGFALCDASSAGNELWYGALTVNKLINTGDVVDFQPGAITFQIDN